MANPEFFKTTFDEYAVDGVIGDPRSGVDAYGYLRVSTEKQGEDGKTGLPRQIMNIHRAATDAGVKIPWNMIFADEDSGFEFETRPRLSALRREIKSGRRRADTVVIENIDRLSRSSKWHQGFLLDEFEKHRVNTVFYKAFTSNIERAVMGAVAEEGMKTTLERMKDSMIIKAKNGKITSKKRAYGYIFVDSDGKPGDKARKDTHYGILEEEANVMRHIYRRLGIDGATLGQVADECNEMYPPPKNYKYWSKECINKLIRNTVYKGVYYSHRWVMEKVWKPLDYDRQGRQGTFVKRYKERPPEEWIPNDTVPPIVSEELWQAAINTLEKNRKMSTRNSKYPFLLTGIIRCATCGLTYQGSAVDGRNEKSPRAIYRCGSRQKTKAYREELGCKQRGITCRVVDDSVWLVVYEVLLKPEILIDALDKQYRGEENEAIEKQIKYLKDQIRTREIKDERAKNAYLAGAYSAEELKDIRDILANEKADLNQELNKISRRIMTYDQYLEKREFILDVCGSAKRNGIAMNSPFDMKKHIIKTIVDEIVLDVENGTFELMGVISGIFPIVNLSNNENNSGNGGNNHIENRSASRRVHNIDLYIVYSIRSKELKTSLINFSGGMEAEMVA